MTPYHGTGCIPLAMSEFIKQDMTIGVLAKQASVGVETIRFYQRKACWPCPIEIVVLENIQIRTQKKSDS